MSITVNIGEAKTRLSELVAKAEAGEEVVPLALRMQSEDALAPDLFWHEAGSLLATALRRNRISEAAVYTPRDDPVAQRRRERRGDGDAPRDQTRSFGLRRRQSRLGFARTLAAGDARRSAGRGRPGGKCPGARAAGRVMKGSDDFAIDALSGLLPMAARDRLAEALDRCEIDMLVTILRICKKVRKANSQVSWLCRAIFSN